MVLGVFPIGVDYKEAMIGLPLADWMGGPLSSLRVDEQSELFYPRLGGTRVRRLMEEVTEYFDHGADLKPGDVVFDVGANIGAFALEAGRRCKGDLELHCFEPVPALHDALEANFANNGCLKKLGHKLYRNALAGPEVRGELIKFYYFRNFPTDSTMDLESKQEEFAAFFNAHGDRFGSQLERRLPSAVGLPAAKVVRSFMGNLLEGPVSKWVSDRVTGLTEVECKLNTISQVMDEGGIERMDLLKVDVEGAELSVLAGIDAAHWPKIDQVALEGHDVEGRLSEIHQLLTTHGFDEISQTRPASVDESLPNFLLIAKRSDG